MGDLAGQDDLDNFSWVEGDPVGRVSNIPRMSTIWMMSFVWLDDVSTVDSIAFILLSLLVV